MSESETPAQPFVLPNTLPLIVLEECYHFPGCDLPLRIFEDRYRAMLKHALETDRVFGVGLRLESKGVFPIVTAGLVKSSVEAEDGTSSVILHGLCRMRISGWEQLTPFPVAKVELLEQTSVSQTQFEEWRKRLCEFLDLRAAKEGGPLARLVKWVQGENSPDRICDVLSFYLVTDSAMLRVLLAEEGTQQRMDALFDSLSRA